MTRVQPETLFALLQRHEARLTAMNNLLTFLVRKEAARFDEPDDIILALAETMRDSAEFFSPNDPDTKWAHEALLEYADDFEERLLDLD